MIRFQCLKCGQIASSNDDVPKPTPCWCGSTVARIVDGQRINEHIVMNARPYNSPGAERVVVTIGNGGASGRVVHGNSVEAGSKVDQTFGPYPLTGDVQGVFPPSQPSPIRLVNHGSVRILDNDRNVIWSGRDWAELVALVQAVKRMDCYDEDVRHLRIRLNDSEQRATMLADRCGELESELRDALAKVGRLQLESGKGKR